jgi:hypothetical protein
MTYNTMSRGLAALGLAAVAASAAGAQQTSASQGNAGPRWHGWTGCWAPVVASAAGVREGTAPGMLVCISPTSNDQVVNVSTIADGKVVSQQTLDASGREQPLTAKGCSGTERASWSADERRLYLRSTSNCDGLRATTSGILSMTANGEWLDVRGVNTYGDENVRIARYHDVGIPSTVPAEIATALRNGGSGMASENARIAAGLPVGTTAVIEATHSADSAVVAAWLMERNQPFTLSAAVLQELAHAGIPGNVSDAMVAVSYPRAFQLARADRINGVNANRDDFSGRRISAMVDPYYYDPYGWGYSAYGYGPNRYGYGYGLGYGGGYYGAGYYGGGYYAPIVIVRDPNTPAGRAQVVKGRGYTQNAGSTQGSSSTSGGQSTRSPSGSSAGASSTAGSSSAGSSAAGSSAGSSGSSESGRTAHARP